MRFSFEKKDFIEQNIESNKVAIIGDDFELTWVEFEKKVNELCDYLVANNLTNLKYPVMIYGHKSANMLVAIYAMMKLEITYIPIDLIYPNERISKILELAKCELIINTTNQKIVGNDVTELLLSNVDYSFINLSQNYTKSDRINDPLVYTIFTSGSTGEPKGVQISTEAIQSFVRWMTSDFGFTSTDVFINTAILSFDLSVFEVMTFSALGATLVLNNKDYNSDPKLLLQRIQKNKGTVWVSTPSFALMYSRMGSVIELNSVKTFLFCGEVLPHGIAKNLVANFNNAKVINTYGPTEATVATTLVIIDQTILDKYDPLPVGRSKPESELLIDDDEIVIVGPNVSIGYLNNPELNKAKFILVDGQRAFKTGDKGYLENGMLFFHGRNDDLVKLHGYRIELSEITTTLNNLSYVLHGETIALKREGIVKKIVSLVQLDSNLLEPIDVVKVKADLAKTLPIYMVPADIKFIEKIPLNQNGKADKQLLTKIYLGE